MPTQTTSFIMNTLKGTHNNTGTSTSIDGSSSSSSSRAKNTTGTTSTTTPTPTHNTTTTTGGNTTPTNSSDNEVKVKNEDNIDGGGGGKGGGSDQNQSMASIPTQNITTSSVAAATAIMTSPTKYDSNDTHHPEPQHTTSSSEKSPKPPPPPATTSIATASSVFATASPYTPPKNSKELFTHIVKILEVTPEQAGALKDSRFVAQEMDVTLKETLICLKELRGRLEQCGQDLDTEFNCIRQILTPSQSAKFLVWVAQNKACMHMLNELWSKNYIDHTDSLSSPTTAMEIAAETATTAETSTSISSKTLLSSSSSEE